MHTNHNIVRLLGEEFSWFLCLRKKIRYWISQAKHPPEDKKKNSKISKLVPFISQQQFITDWKHKKLTLTTKLCSESKHVVLKIPLDSSQLGKEWRWFFFFFFAVSLIFALLTLSPLSFQVPSLMSVGNPHPETYETLRFWTNGKGPLTQKFE